MLVFIHIGHAIFIAFSMIANGAKLLNTTTRPSTKHLASLNGMRVFSTFWVILGHSYTTTLMASGMCYIVLIRLRLPSKK